MTQSVIEFWDHLASLTTYKDALVGWYDDHNADPKEALLFRNIPLTGNEIALDFGCGPGRNMIKFKDRFKRIDGADISKIILEKAKADLIAANVAVPNLYHIDGHSLPMIADNTYDVVFSIICMQHISCRDWRLELYREFHRVLKPGGYFTFQMGYGPGHPLSEDYFHNYAENEPPGHRDVRVEDSSLLFDDLFTEGFVDMNSIITEPCKDQHPNWIWVRCQRGR